MVKRLCAVFFIALLFAASGSALDLKESAAALAGADKLKVIAAIRDLGLANTPAAAEVLAARLPAEKDNYIKIKILEALAVYPSSTSIAGVTAMTRDPNPQVRQAAIMSLSAFPGSRKVVPELKNALENDTDKGVRQCALNGLSGYGSDQEALDSVEKVLADKKADIRARRAAARCLTTMDSPEAKKRLDKYKNDADNEVKSTINRKLSEKKLPVKKPVNTTN